MRSACNMTAILLLLLLAASVTIVECCSGRGGFSKVSFSSVDPPKIHPAKHHLRASPALELCLNETDCFTQPIRYHVLMRSGEGIPCLADNNRHEEGQGEGEGNKAVEPKSSDLYVRSKDRGGSSLADVEEGEKCEEIFGLTKDKNSRALSYTNMAGADSNILDVSDNPDFSSLLQVGDSIFSIVQFEYPRPGTMYITKLNQDEQGNLSPESSRHVDWSHANGLWIPCAGSVSPWNTHIGGEEYEPDAKYFSPSLYQNDSSICGSSYGVCTSIECAQDTISSTVWNQCSELRESYAFAKYLSDEKSGPLYPQDIDGIEALRKIMNPYDYGYVFEVQVHEDGSYDANKWYSTGRRSNELAYILPDEKTMYLSDDGTNVVFQMFVADEPRNFSSGTLYAAKFKQQTDGSKGGTFAMEWIDLGWAQSSDIEEAAKTLQFSDIFELEEPLVDFSTRPYTAVCSAGFTAVNTGSAGVECLKVKQGMDIIASRLESRRYSALLGATTEFTKLEGITFDSKRNLLYAAISDIKNGMEDNNVKYDIGGENDIKVSYNKCGCVYTLELDDQNRALSMYPLVCGDSSTGTDSKNYCDLNGVANPDNVAYMQDFDTLLIAEDTKNHENNVLWAYHFEESSPLERIFVAPLGAEVTSPYLHKLKDFFYISITAQHPYESNQFIYSTDSTGKAGYVGYLGPIDMNPPKN